MSSSNQQGGGCAFAFVLLLAIGAAIWLIEFIVRTPWLAIALVVALLVLGVLTAIGGYQNRNTLEARQARDETARLAVATKRVERLKAEAAAERLHATMVKDRLRLEAEAERLQAEVDASLEKRMND